MTLRLNYTQINNNLYPVPLCWVTRALFIVTLNVIMLSIVMLNVIMLTVVMLNEWNAPYP
jgi:hypothetical protein